MDNNTESRAAKTLKELELRRIDLAGFGWHEIEKSECDAIWNRFMEFYRCNENRFDIPSPSKSWDLRHVIELSKESKRRWEMLNDLQYQYIRAIRECQLPNERWLALDFNHPCYYLDIEKIDSSFDRWPVEALPDIDEGYFVSEDFSAGIITVLRSSVCVYGQRLIASMKRSLPIAFSRPNGEGRRIEPKGAG